MLPSPVPTPEEVARAQPRRSTHYLPVRIRLEQIRALTARGWTTARIARHLNVSPRTVRRDVGRLRRLQDLEFARLADSNARLHQIEVHRLVQAAAWQAVDAILDTGDLNYRNLAPLLRTVALSQRALDRALIPAEPPAAHPATQPPRPLTIKDLVMQFTDEELDADLHQGAPQAEENSEPVPADRVPSLSREPACPERSRRVEVRTASTLS